MRTTCFSYVSEIALFSRRLVKHIISTLLLVFIVLNLDFSVFIQPLASNEALVVNDIGLLTGLLAILFLGYSQIIQLKEYTGSCPETVIEQDNFVGSELTIKREYTSSTVYFWTGGFCSALFALI